jgi:hypothetical protein
MEDKKQKKLLYNKEYDVSNTVQIRLKLNKKTDADILDRLDAVPNKQGYIKGLIRDDIENEVPPH